MEKYYSLNETAEILFSNNTRSDQGRQNRKTYETRSEKVRRTHNKSLAKQNRKTARQNPLIQRKFII